MHFSKKSKKMGTVAILMILLLQLVSFNSLSNNNASLTIQHNNNIINNIIDEQPWQHGARQLNTLNSTDEQQQNSTMKQLHIHMQNSTEINNDDTYLHDNDNVFDELPSCGNILVHETIEDRCHHARNCEGEYLMTTLLPLAFCNNSHQHHGPILAAIFPVIFPVSLLILTLLLFRLLGSTAENYFSPALEMISSEFNIPPQLAGVTLLALGNGAPDVSAVVNAIKMNAAEGIPLSLGELTGGGMFVQSVVVGRIVFLGSIYRSNLSGEKVLGVTCREDLIRDISMYTISALYVYWMCSLTVIFYRHVVAMLLLYSGYVAVVLMSEMRRYYSNPEKNFRIMNNEEEEDGSVDYHTGDDMVPFIETAPTNSYNEEDQTTELSLSQKKKPDPPGYNQSARVLRLLKKEKLRQQQQLLEKRKSLKSLVDDNIDDPQDQSSSKQQDRRIWSIELLADSLRELGRHLFQALYSDILTNSELSRFEWWCMLLESPFIILRKLVTPIPCEDDYNRSMVAYSIAFSPIWLVFYVSTKVEDFDPFCTSDGSDDDDEKAGFCFPLVVWPCCISFAIGFAVIKYAPRTGLPLRYSLPIALYGFLVAAVRFFSARNNIICDIAYLSHSYST